MCAVEELDVNKNSKDGEAHFDRYLHYHLKMMVIIVTDAGIPEEPSVELQGLMRDLLWKYWPDARRSLYSKHYDRVIMWVIYIGQSSSKSHMNLDIFQYLTDFFNAIYFTKMSHTPNLNPPSLFF